MHWNNLKNSFPVGICNKSGGKAWGSVLGDTLNNVITVSLISVVGHDVSRKLSLPQQLLDVSVMMVSKLLVAKLGFNSSWPSISLPFSLVVTEHMALFHILIRDPPVDMIADTQQSHWFDPTTRREWWGRLYHPGFGWKLTSRRRYSECGSPPGSSQRCLEHDHPTTTGQTKWKDQKIWSK